MAGFGTRHHMPINKNEKTDFKSVKKLFLYVKPYLLSIIIALLLAVLGAITTIIGPEKISDLMNVITKGITSFNGVNMDKFVEIAILLLCLYLVGAIANYIQQFLMAGVTQKTSKRLRTDINKKINNLPLKYFDTTTRGDILSRVTNDVDVISQTFASTISNLVNAITLFFGVLIMMFTVNWILALVTIGTSIFGFVLMSVILSRSQKYFNLRQQNLGEMNGHIEEIYTNHNVVKSYNAEEKTQEKFKRINNNLFFNNWKSQALSGLMHPLMGFAGNLSYALIFIVGVALILNGSNMISFGTIISFTIYARLFSQPLTTIAQSMNSIQQTAAASKRVFDLLDEKELINESQKKAKIEEKETKGLNSIKTTMVMLLITDNIAQWGHVGDSRLYHFRDGKQKSRTIDHSVPQMLALSGEIKEKEIRHHPDRSVLLRAMGSEWNSPQYEIAQRQMRVVKGDSFLLCSDGFWEWIDEKSISKILKKDLTAYEALQEMTEEVKANGIGKGMDNYSAILVNIK